MLFDNLFAKNSEVFIWMYYPENHYHCSAFLGNRISLLCILYSGLLMRNLILENNNWKTVMNEGRNGPENIFKVFIFVKVWPISEFEPRNMRRLHGNKQELALIWYVNCGFFHLIFLFFLCSVYACFLGFCMILFLSNFFTPKFKLLFGQKNN